MGMHRHTFGTTHRGHCSHASPGNSESEGHTTRLTFGVCGRAWRDSVEEWGKAQHTESRERDAQEQEAEGRDGERQHAIHANAQASSSAQCTTQCKATKQRVRVRGSHHPHLTLK